MKTEKRDLPTDLPTQDIHLLPINLDRYEFRQQNSLLYLILENKTGSDVEFDSMEVEIWGYADKNDTPGLVFSTLESSVRGKKYIPLPQTVYECDFLYTLQVSDYNPIGAAAALNPPGAYALSWNPKKEAGSNY